jgi:hypothetical protein
MGHIDRDFHLAYALKRHGKGFQRCIIQDVAGVKDVAGIELDPLRTTLRTDFRT